jgi:hypothetical protein
VKLSEAEQRARNEQTQAVATLVVGNLILNDIFSPLRLPDMLMGNWGPNSLMDGWRDLPLRTPFSVSTAEIPL